MTTVALIVIGAAFAWLARDAWRLRGGARLPYSELLKLRKQTADHLTVQEQSTLQAYEERHLIGKTDYMFLVFAIISTGSFSVAFLKYLFSW